MGNNNSQLSMTPQTGASFSKPEYISQIAAPVSSGGVAASTAVLTKTKPPVSPLIIFTVVNTILVLGVIVMYLCMVFLYLSKDWVDSKNCVAPIGEFTVEPAVDVGNVLLSCPEHNFDDKGTCIYDSVPSLLQATRICNQQADICSRFVYNSNAQKMKIVSLQGTPNTGSQYDNTYTRQANITFRTSGNSPSSAPPTLGSPDPNPFTITDSGEVVPTTVVSDTATGL